MGSESPGVRVVQSGPKSERFGVEVGVDRSRPPKEHFKSYHSFNDVATVIPLSLPFSFEYRV